MKLMCFELLWFTKKNQIHVFFKFFKLAKTQIHVLRAFLACKKLKFMFRAFQSFIEINFFKNLKTLNSAPNSSVNVYFPLPWEKVEI